MGTETKTKIVVGLAVALSFFAGLSVGFGWSYLWYVLAIGLISICLLYLYRLAGQADNTTFIICDRDEYNTIDEDDLEVRE